MSKKRKNKKRASPVHNKKERKIVYKPDPTKRKMSPEELKEFLRENNRGCGVHGLISNKAKRRKDRQKIKGGDYEKK